MESHWSSALKEINGINLDNYFLHQRDFNRAVYVHKKFLPGRKDIYQDTKAKTEEAHKCKHDKAQQYNFEFQDNIKEKKNHRVGINNESVLEQTIRFAKNLVPIVIPPSRDKSPVYYTIKTSKKCKRKSKTHESGCEPEATHEKTKCKKTTETYRKEKVNHRESFSARESNSRSSRCNTLDDINMNQSLSCTVSEVSERKYRKKEVTHNQKQHDAPKLILSESFEALATETLASDAKIKIHLMKNRDKNLLTDSIRDPIMDGLKQCFQEIRSIDVTNGVSALQKEAVNNKDKLDFILEKLTCIEEKLDAAFNHRANQKARASTLEQLGQDLKEASEDDSHDMNIKEDDKVVEFLYIGKNKAESGYGEGGIELASTGIKTDRSSRHPARYCWTDVTNRKN